MKRRKKNNKPKYENPIHIKLECNEAIQSKKDFLLSERDLVNIAKIIREYRILRVEELRIKLMLYKKLKEIKASLSKLQKLFPEPKIPEILKKEEKEIKEEIDEKKIEKKVQDQSLESQLKEIQNRLNVLQR